MKEMKDYNLSEEAKVSVDPDGDIHISTEVSSVMLTVEEAMNLAWRLTKHFLEID